ncbi:MAG: delta-60 repeat domain-containing protein [Spirochaetes bacterium]|nr:delta-60 repeat domain-containing protein [Spirochaetota bacterium]
MCTEVHNNRLYFGGDFTRVWANVAGAAWLDTNTGMLVAGKKHPYVHGEVYAVASDGAGGWYIGGDFNKINNETRNYIARINMDGSLHEWNPDSAGVVQAIVVSGETVYIGGNIDGMTGGRNCYGIAAIDAVTGLAYDWGGNGTNGTVNAMAMSGNLLYIGGQFTRVNGDTDYPYIAALDLSTGLPTAWYPNSNGAVFTIAVHDDEVYAGGSFTSIGGEARDYIASLNAATGAATDFNVGYETNGVIRTIAILPRDTYTIVYVGGEFTIIGASSSARNHIAAIDRAAGTIRSWDPNANGIVQSVTLNENTLYTTGLFTTIAGQTRNYAAGFTVDPANEDVVTITEWDPDCQSTVNAIGLYGNTAFIGGNFTHCCARDRSRIASVELSTGVLTAWNPGANIQVRALAGFGNTIYAGGNFTTIGGQPRDYIAALDAETGIASAWDTDSDSTVVSIIATKSRIYAGGYFNFIGGVSRDYIAALDPSTGSAVAGWDPDPNAEIMAMVLAGGDLYVGGSFTVIGGESRDFLACLDARTAAASAWDPGASNMAYSVAIMNDTIYSGGLFSSIGVDPRNRIAAIDLNGNATAFDPNADNTIYMISHSDRAIYAGGLFQNIGTQARNRIAALDPVTGIATSWDPNLDSSVWTLSLSGNCVFAGGFFSTVGTDPYVANSLVGIDADTGLPYGM